MRWPSRLVLLMGSGPILACATAAWAAPPYPPNCRCTVAICPSGDLVSTIVVRDIANNPVPLSSVMIQVNSGSTLHACDGSALPPALGQTDVTGVAQFHIAGVGASPGAATVFADGTPICTNAPVAGPDLTANGLVDAADMQLLRTLIGTPDPRGDFDGDHVVTPADTLVAAAHLGHACTGSYGLSTLTPGSVMDLIVAFDGLPITYNLAGGGSANDELSGEMTLTVGPRLDPTQTRIELSSLAMFGAGFVCGNGATGALQLMIGDDQGPVTGIWTGAGTFSLGPFRAFIHSALADSMAGIVVPDTVDVVPISGDSVTCVISGSILPLGGSYRRSWNMTVTSTANPSPYIEITGAHADQPPGTQPAQAVGCQLCKSLCFVPVIVSDTDGGNPGVSGADFKALTEKAIATWDKCCIQLVQAIGAVSINDTDLNTWAAGENLGAYTKKIRNKLAEKQAGSGKPLVDDKMLEKCVVVTFLNHGNGPDGGGESFQNGADLAINVNHLKTKCPGGPGKPDPDSRVLAHELGHTLGLPQAHVAGGDNIMADCGPSDTVAGGLSAGDEGELGGQCTTVYKCKKLMNIDKPCFKPREQKPQKCTVKIPCK